MGNRLIHKLEQFGRRFFSAPFANLPAEYGDTVPPDIARVRGRG